MTHSAPLAPTDHSVSDDRASRLSAVSGNGSGNNIGERRRPGPRRRPMPDGFAAYIADHTTVEARAYYSTGPSVISRWIKEAGLKELMASRIAEKPMPVDFALYAERSNAELRDRYKVGSEPIARWRKAVGIKRKPQTGIPPVQKKPVPTGFAEQASRHTLVELARRYKVSNGVIERWLIETGAQTRRYVRPIVKQPVALLPPADASRTGQAAHYLRRYFVPVYDRAKVEGRRFQDQWRVGSRTLLTSEMVAAAEAKGFVPWLDAA